MLSRTFSEAQGLKPLYKIHMIPTNSLNIT
jgi:hypothetical protein